MKHVYSITLEKLVRVWKRGNLQDVNNIITQFSLILYLWSGCTQWISLVLSVISIDKIETNLHKRSTIENSDLSYINSILDKIINQLVFDFYLIDSLDFIGLI